MKRIIELSYRVSILVMTMLVAVGVTACASVKKEPVDIKAPEIRLTDVLSSKKNEFPVKSGNYSLNVPDGKETHGVVACGMSPLDENQKKMDVLDIPDYNGTEEFLYQFSCDTEPSKLTVHEWDASLLGETEAEAEATMSYEDAFILQLKHGKVYEIVAEWNEEKAETNGFYGEASYVVVTD